MVAAALRVQLNTHVATMYAEGVVDKDTFEELRENGTAAEVVRFFINNACQILGDIRALIEQPAVHFNEVEALLQQLMECTSRLPTMPRPSAVAPLDERRLRRRSLQDEADQNACVDTEQPPLPPPLEQPPSNAFRKEHGTAVSSSHGTGGSEVFT
ncbi:uncharacterized protein [Triticum aestivum]|uniref:uncharacterized protein n=1 Tax=Triticum aestivum TaxID=4565 RepID=UPI001D0134AC|nr:uncharacterized protein LOC123089870 [Triticum aestivum]